MARPPNVSQAVSPYNIAQRKSNPYQQVISTLGSTLHHFNEAGTVHAFGFGDDKTRTKTVFPFKPGGEPCSGFQEVLMR